MKPPVPLIFSPRMTRIRPYSLVSHLPQNASTGLLPLNSLFQVSFSTTARMTYSELQYPFTNAGIIGTSIR